MQLIRSLVCAMLALVGLVACGGGGLNPAPNTGGYEYPNDDGYGYDDSYRGPYNDDYDYGYECDGVAIGVNLVGVVGFKTFETDTLGKGDQAKFVLTYAATAIGGDVAMSTRCTEGDVTAIAALGSTYAVTNSDSNVTSVTLSLDGDLLGEGLIFIQEGDTVVFTIVVTVTATADAFAQVSLLSIGWAPAYCVDEDWLYIDLEGFETDPVFLNFWEEKG